MTYQRAMRTRSACSTLLSLAAVACVSCGGPGPSVEGPVVAAILHGDGFLVPFAAYQDGAWRAADPDSIADRPRAWFGDRGDIRGSWRLVTPLGLVDSKGEPLPLEAVGEPVEVASHCERVWAIATDFAGRPTPANGVHRVVGAAASGGAARQVAALDQTLPDTARVLEFLQPMFDAAEGNLVRERDTGGPEALRRGSLAAKASLAFTRLSYVTTRDRTTIYQFEAARLYARAPASADRSCDEATIMTGWLTEGPPGELALVRSDTVLTDCDRKEATTLQPLGTLEVDGRRFVVIVEYQWASESYAIYEVLAETVAPVLRVWAGGC